MMQVLNFFIIYFVFWVSARIGPSYVHFDTSGDMVRTTLLCYLLLTMAALIMMIGIIKNRSRISALAGRELAIFIIALIVLMTIVGFLALLLAEYAISGFSITGFIPTLLVAFAISISSVHVKIKTESR